MDRSAPRRHGRGALALLAAGIVFVFAEAFMGRAPVMRDFIGFTYPSRAAFRAVLERGELSSWNPLGELGLSRLAAPVHGALYPGHLLLPVGGLETGVVITWLLHAGWAALGGYLLGRAAGARAVAAVISGAIWAFGGYAVSMWWNGEKVLTDAWLPWFGLGIERAVTARAFLSPWSALAALAAAMICYAGDPFLLIHAFALAAAVMLARPVAVPSRTRLGELSRGVVPTLLGLGLAGPPLICALAARGDTVRSASLETTIAEAWSLNPARLPELFLPGWFGSPFDVEHYPGAAFADDPTRQALPWAVSIYGGAASIVLAPLVRNRRALFSLGGVAAFFLLLALGRHTPLNALFCRVVPGLSLFRYPEKHLVVTVGLVGLLAALGAEEALSKRIAPWRLAAPTIAVLSLAVVLAPAPLRSSAVSGAIRAVLASTLLVASLELVSRRREWALAPAVVVVLDLATAARPFLRWGEPPLFVSPFMSLLEPRLGVAPPRVYRSGAADFEDAATWPSSAGQVFGIATLPAHDPASTPRLGALFKRLGSEPGRMAQVLSLDAFLLPREVAFDMSPTASVSGMSLYLLPPPPRTWVVGAVRFTSTADALHALASEAFDPYAEAVVPTNDDPSMIALAREQSGRAGTCTINSYDRAQVDLVCNAERDGLAVVAELYADGWTAALDGEPARLVPVDLVLRGVALQAGRHRIAMRYETPGLAEGLTVAGASALLLLLGLALAHSRARALTAKAPP